MQVFWKYSEVVPKGSYIRIYQSLYLSKIPVERQFHLCFLMCSLEVPANDESTYDIMPKTPCSMSWH